MSDQKTNKEILFPLKLHQILDLAEENGHENIVSWSSGGLAFKIHDKEIFSEEVMPKFFGSSKFKTFQRNLNLWGFATFTKADDGDAARGSCFHPFFQRGRPELCSGMHRVRIKGNGVPRGEKKTPQGFQKSTNDNENILSELAANYSAAVDNRPSIAPATSGLTESNPIANMTAITAGSNIRQTASFQTNEVQHLQPTLLPSIIGMMTNPPNFAAVNGVGVRQEPQQGFAAAFLLDRILSTMECEMRAIAPSLADASQQHLLPSAMQQVWNDRNQLVGGGLHHNRDTHDPNLLDLPLVRKAAMDLLLSGCLINNTFIRDATT